MKKIIISLLFTTTAITFSEQPTPKTSLASFLSSIPLEEYNCFLHCVSKAAVESEDPQAREDIFNTCYKKCMKIEFRKRMNAADSMKEHARYLLDK